MSAGQSTPSGSAVAVRVPDMTCGHCVGTISKALQRAIPGATVATDLDKHLVTVQGAEASIVHEIIRDAGYTPEPANA
jgi:copper chaperone